MTTLASERLALHRASDPLDPWAVNGLPVPKGITRDVREVLDVASRLLGRSPVASPAIDYLTASAALSEVWNLVADAIRGDHLAAERVCTTDELWGLLERLGDTRDALRESRTTQREQALRQVAGALGRLSGARTPAQLTAVGVEALCEVGFDRAIAGDVRDSVWRTRAMCVRGDPEWAAEIVTVAQANPRQLRSGLVESEAARRRAAIVVTNVQSEDHVHRQIAEASLSRSYVTAPVLVEGCVVGLLHADCYFQRRNVDDVDRDLLAAFAAGYGYALHRTMLQTRLATLRDSVGRLTGELTATVDAAVSGCAHGPSVPDECLLEPHPAGTGRDGYSAGSTLSPRELDVLRLMAAGETNARIATRLVLSEGTVKTHVRGVLRKLGAANRAEAVTRWLSGRGPHLR
jgi:DNA-binding CsgD family transcriptional regulator/GAF domain-containing protein